MTLREAQAGDIDQMMIVRLSVNENRLSNPALITKEDYEEYLFRRGKGWVCETGNTIIGFSIADLEEHNVWALFITPGYEKKGIGRRLHDMMIDWYFSKTHHTIWLSTAPGSRAERFYRQAGWKEVGHTTQGEIKFEMSYEDHRNRHGKTTPIKGIV